ncbi:hypothetical protein PAUR_a2519 [Pseudoalteromonas aurantia 208]|uniref:Transposase n=1 Tax=Pseudoalteromonas aurantia 208 TaxID=1314867 RepID=A0ABR9EEV8_9GAMM|nr:hypothetical protein [Pseudoalteromonas aurantia 208]
MLIEQRITAIKTNNHKNRAELQKVTYLMTYVTNACHKTPD